MKLNEKISNDHLSSSQNEDIVLSLNLHDKKEPNVVKTGASFILKTIYKNLIPDVLASDAAGEYNEILTAHKECWIHRADIRMIVGPPLAIQSNCSTSINHCLKDLIPQFIEHAQKSRQCKTRCKFLPLKLILIPFIF